ncbi:MULTISPECIES: hypothetical protein [Pseudanabaena]|uniref:Uncharacterized protein n=1 Tax=Pseudanabaena catenata USMAC16 TaxID=1855837 RepID=A0A9X4RHV2_9CYAN|nr:MULTISPECIES: hypothetical protein [Pseudanabaena]MDG3494941.1 hypothetical protein [Pseudanabaena catenata USMAC16]
MNYSYIHLSQDIKPNREWRREAPPLNSWGLCSSPLGDSYKPERIAIAILCNNSTEA